MKNKKNNKLATGILAAGAGITAAAINELLLSKEDHNRKEKEINRLEKEKKKYLKKIGEYEPFDIDKGRVTPNDGKLVNLLTRAVGVAFSNDDVFNRNKSNIRTFPFIITNNSSITATIEVELRKYYELLIATQVANLIDHTVFSTDAILNMKDTGRRTVDKVVDEIINRRGSIEDLGQNLQRGLYENVVIIEDGEVVGLSEAFANMFGSFQDYENAYNQVIRNFAKGGQQQRLQADLTKLSTSREELLQIRQNILRHLSYSIAQGAQITPQLTDAQNLLKDVFEGTTEYGFDDIETGQVLKELDTLMRSFRSMVTRFDAGNEIFSKVPFYVTKALEYRKLLDRGIQIINNNNWQEPDKNLVDADPYYKLLGLNAVTDYANQSKLLMKMHEGSNTAKVRLEMAAALLISTEILPSEFIEYVTKFLGLPMSDDTKRQIGLKYGLGDANNPFVFMGNNYIIKNMGRQEVLQFQSEIKPAMINERESILRNLSDKDLKRRVPSMWNWIRNREALEKRWNNKYGRREITKALESLYEVGNKLNKKELRKINNADKSSFGRFIGSMGATTKNKQINKLVNKHLDKYQDAQEDMVDKIQNTAQNDKMFAKTLSLLGANGNRVNVIIENRLKNKIVDLTSVQNIDKSIEYFTNPGSNQGINPTDAFIPNLEQTRTIMTFLQEDFEDELIMTVLTEDVMAGITENVLNEAPSYVYNVTAPTRRVQYQQVEKDPIEYVLPNYTKGKALLYGSTEIDKEQFRNRKVGEPIWIKVTFSDKVNSMKADVTDNDYTTVIGIKSEVFRVPEKDITAVLSDPNRRVSGVANIFKTQRDQTLGLLSKIASENDLKGASMNGVLITSLNEATTAIATKPSEDYLNNPDLAVRLRKNYNLSSVALVDPISEEYYIMEENSTSWSRLPFSELRGGGAGGQDLKLLAGMMGRGGR